MRILIIGGGGFLGNRLAHTLLDRGAISIEGSGKKEISEITLYDRTFTSYRQDERLKTVIGDISEMSDLEQLFNSSFDIIYHLAAIVSGEAELDFDQGMMVNLEASMNILEILRKKSENQVFVFASTCAVFGGNIASDVVRDDSATTPESSYGTQKAIIELLINDYSRRGFINGRTLRLPTIIVRPGKPNAANSSFASSIIREPLKGEIAHCPVSKETYIWVLSPNSVIENFIHAARLDISRLGSNRMITLPGLTTSVNEIVTALEKLYGFDISELIKFTHDTRIQTMVETWPTHFATKRANDLGFVRDNSIQEIIEQHFDEVSS